MVREDVHISGCQEAANKARGELERSLLFINRLKSASVRHSTMSSFKNLYGVYCVSVQYTNRIDCVCAVPLTDHPAVPRRRMRIFWSWWIWLEQFMSNFLIMGDLIVERGKLGSRLCLRFSRIPASKFYIKMPLMCPSFRILCKIVAFIRCHILYKVQVWGMFIYPKAKFSLTRKQCGRFGMWCTTWENWPSCDHI